MSLFVIVQRVESGEAKLSSLRPLDFVTACQAQRSMAAVYPTLRFEIANCTRSVRRKLGELPCFGQMPPQPTPSVAEPAAAAQKFAESLASKIGKSFAGGFLKSIKMWPKG